MYETTKGVEMKLAKLSLAAIVALGVSAFADVENVKFSGNAKLFYGTNDADVTQNVNGIATRRANGDIFSKNNSYGQVAATIAATADLSESVKGKISVVGLSTLGLENNLVSGVWAGATSNTGAVTALNSQWWVNEAWLAKTFGNTTLKVGRQELDTPLAFSEKWNIAANSFDAAVVLNNDLPQTTLVAAWVGRGNGAAGQVVVGVQNGADPFQTYGSAIDAAYGLNLASGAYAVAAVTKLIPNTVAQVWYYDVVDIAQAWWLQADVDLADLTPGLTFGAQYAYLDPTDSVDAAVSRAVGARVSLDESSAWAVKVGYGMDNLKLAAAYSSTDEDGVVVIANTATGAAVGSQSKLYTEAWWSYGYVGAPNADAWTVSAEYNWEDVANFGAYYTNVNDAETTKAADVIAGRAVAKNDMTEFTLTASKSFGSLDATLAYIYTDADDQNVDPVTNTSDSYNTIQVYLTYNF